MQAPVFPKSVIGFRISTIIWYKLFLVLSVENRPFRKNCRLLVELHFLSGTISTHCSLKVAKSILFYSEYVIALVLKFNCLVKVGF